MDVKELINFYKGNNITIKLKSNRSLFGLYHKYECRFHFKKNVYLYKIFNDLNEIEYFINQHNPKQTDFFVKKSVFNIVKEYFNESFNDNFPILVKPYKENHFITYHIDGEKFFNTSLYKKFSNNINFLENDLIYFNLNRDQASILNYLKLYSLNIKGISLHIKEHDFEHWVDDILDFAKFYPKILDVEL